MSKKASSKVTAESTICLLGGREMTMNEYAAYMQALGAKPFLSVHEASIYFNIGINKLYKLMKDPTADFVVDANSMRQYARIHREAFEKWLLSNGGNAKKEV